MTHDIRLSKSLSYILRHGASKERLTIREDGYMEISHIVILPRFFPYQVVNRAVITPSIRRIHSR